MSGLSIAISLVSGNTEDIEDAMKKPAWAKRTDAVNLTIVGVIMLLMIWEAVSRLFH
jgi:hypothetical protein